MRIESPVRRRPEAAGPDPAEPAFLALLYRFLFFDWLFADMTQARNLLERRAAWQHNRRMRKHLPTYLRRWATLAVATFVLGWLAESGLQATLLAACCFTGSCATLPVMTVIAVAWAFLARPDTPAA